MDFTQHGDVQHLMLTSDWVACSTMLQGQFPLLSDADQYYEKGKEGELYCKLATRLYLTNAEVMILLHTKLMRLSGAGSSRIIFADLHG